MNYEELFQARYKNLNPEQKQAVDTLDGPVLVIAGPGSGKTELLSIRVANILQKTDTLASSILCLTFTESAAANMRDRLSKIIGYEAYKIAIHTFHGFGTEIINSNSEHFYKGAIFQPIDNLTQVEILEEILEKLDHKSQLNSYHPTQGYTYLYTIIRRIDEFKKAGLTPKELKKVLEENKQFLTEANPVISGFFSDRISKKVLEKLPQVLVALNQIKSNSELKDIIISSLNEAYNQEDTKPLTAWKNKFTKADTKKQRSLKDFENIEKQLELADIYAKYQEKIHEKGYFDFSDMILRTAKTLEENPDLKYNIQERYQYVLVDEFQDTNGVQMRLLDNILDSDINNGRPNIMAVGDDDQAIYKFQGAQLSNVLNFHKKYRDPALVVLDKNYRSTQKILDEIRKIILKGEDRLENSLPDQIKKELLAKNPKIQGGIIKQKEFSTEVHELLYIAEQINQKIEEGTPLSEIALITRKHKDLVTAAKIFDQANIPISYERKKNILEQKHIREIILILKFISSTANDELMPELLAAEFWGLSRNEVWELSVQAYKERRLWLELMQERESTKEIADFLIYLEVESKILTAEEIIDLITGTTERENFSSPYKEFYFNKEKFHESSNEYMDYLQSLQTLFDEVRKFRGGKALKVKDLIEFVDLHEKHNLQIYSTSPSQNKNAVQLMTAHKAKGLEFDTVFISGCQDSTWTRGQRSEILTLPANLPLSPQKDNNDDNLRLFYVAMSRARRNLFLTFHQQDQDGRPQIKLRFLDHLETEFIESDEREHQNILKIKSTLPVYSPQNDEENAFLKEIIQNYQLSVTHLNNFLDVTEGGPQNFLHKNLLRFPQKQSPSASYGSAVHQALDHFHKSYKQNRELPSKQNLLDKFTESLNYRRLNKNDYKKLQNQGLDELATFYEQKIQEISPYDLSEYDFRNQGVRVGLAEITGKIDRMQINEKEKEIAVIDYKTGKPLESWNGAYGYNAIKKWKYINQIIFYNLLVENSRTFGSTYKVKEGRFEFVKANKDNEIVSLSLAITSSQIERMKILIKAVWQKIKNLDFPDTEIYPKTPQGISAFEEDLIQSIITPKNS